MMSKPFIGHLNKIGKILMNLSNMDFTQLLELKNEVEAEIKRRESEEKAKAKKQIIELARLHGLSAADLIGKTLGSSGSTRKPVAAKYAHPSNPSITWTGRGRKPLWVLDWLSKDKLLTDLLIK